MSKYLVRIAAVCAVSYVALSFLTNEYYFWESSVTCTSKCKRLGCTDGLLLTGHSRTVLACKCTGDMDHLMLLN